MLEHPELAESTRKSVHDLMELLGFAVALEEKKNKAFSTVFGMLGVDVDLSRVGEGTLKVANTETRKAELVAEIDAIIQEGLLKPPAAASFRGRFGFAHAQCYGKAVAPQLKEVSDRAVGKSSSYIDAALLGSLEALKFFLLETKPREVCIGRTEQPMLLNTDGACVEQVHAKRSSSSRMATCTIGAQSSRTSS